ncbi:MAG: hypothetical protein WCA45_09785 [Thiobacillaceae bacterium]
MRSIETDETDETEDNRDRLPLTAFFGTTDYRFVGLPVKAIAQIATGQIDSAKLSYRAPVHPVVVDSLDRRSSRFHLVCCRRCAHVSRQRKVYGA